VRAIDFFARRYDYGRGAPHARKVADLAGSLFDQLQHLELLPGCPLAARNVLFAACLAHDVGMSDRARADVGILPSWAATAAYEVTRVVGFQALRMVLDNPPPPLDPTELSREDRCGLLYLTLWNGDAALREVPDEPLMCVDVVRSLVGIVRLADCLEFRCNSLVSTVRLLATESSVRIIVNSLGNVTEEVTCAATHASFLAASLKKRVVVQEVVAPQLQE